MIPVRIIVLLVIMLTPLLLASAPASADVKWGVHLASYRTEANAKAGWMELRARHYELLGELQCHYVPVNVPGQGEYLRLIAGPLEAREQAMALAQDLRHRGAYADTMPCPEGSTATAAEPSQPAVAAAATSQKRVASLPSPALPATPSQPTVAAPAAPAGPAVPGASNSASGADSARDLAATGEKLRKYIPAPVVDSFKAILGPLSDGEQQKREQLPSPPQSSAPGLTGKGHHVGFNNDGRPQTGLPLASAPRGNSHISAQYGNMEEDFETPASVAPLSPGENSHSFKPYLGLGLHF